MAAIPTISADFWNTFIPLLPKSAPVLGFHFDQLQAVNESIVTAKLNLFIEGVFKRSPFAKLPRKRPVNKMRTASSFHVIEISSIGNLPTGHHNTRLLLSKKEDCSPSFGSWFAGVGVNMKIERHDDPVINSATLRLMRAFTQTTDNELLPVGAYTPKDDGYIIQANGSYEMLVQILTYSKHSIINRLEDYLQDPSTDDIPSKTIDIRVYDEFCSVDQHYYDIVYHVAGPVMLDKTNLTNLDCPPADHKQYEELKKIVETSLHKTSVKWFLHEPKWMKVGILYCSENNTLMADATMLYTRYILQLAADASNEDVVAHGQPWYEKFYYRSLENHKTDEVFPFSLIEADQKSFETIHCDKSKSKLISSQTLQFN